MTAQTIARVSALMRLRMVLKEAMSPRQDAPDGTEKKAVTRNVG